MAPRSSIISDPQSHAFCLILEPDTLLSVYINVSSFITATLLLVLLLGEALSPGDNQILVSLLSIVVRNICVTGQAVINLDILWNSREWLVDLLLLQDWLWRQWRIEDMRSGCRDGFGDLRDLCVCF